MGGEWGSEGERGRERERRRDGERERDRERERERESDRAIESARKRGSKGERERGLEVMTCDMVSSSQLVALSTGRPANWCTITLGNTEGKLAWQQSRLALGGEAAWPGRRWLGADCPLAALSSAAGSA